MNPPGSDDILDLLIVGAGPVGLTAALEARRLGLSVRIVDRKEDRSVKDARAVVVHPRVMELLEAIRGGALTSAISNIAFNIRGVFAYLPEWFEWHHWISDCGRDSTHTHSDSDFKNNSKQNTKNLNPVLLDVTRVVWGDTDYPNLFFLPQYETERCLEEVFNAEGGEVEYGFTMEDLTQENDVVTTTIRNNSMDKTKSIRSRWVLGADGGRSKTRDLMGLQLDRHNADVYYAIADISFTGEPPLGSHAPGKGGHIFPSGPAAFFPLPGDNAYRAIGRAPPGIRSKDDVLLDERFFQDLLFCHTGRRFELKLSEWRTVFQITHGVTDSFRKGNVMLAGDASHVHSPIGGQGMNLGMQDSTNLLWKLAWSKRILNASSSNEDCINAEKVVSAILDTYDSERRSLGIEIVKHVNFATKMASVSNPFIKFFRNAFLRFMLPSDHVKMNFHKLGQLGMAYEPSCSALLFETNSWTTHYICSAGQRLPNIRLKDGSKLYSHIDRIWHTWVILNSSSDEEVSEAIPPSWEANIAHVRAADSEKQKSIPVISKIAYAAPQVILVRPDQFVAAVGSSPEAIIAELRKAGMSETALATM